MKRVLWFICIYYNRSEFWDNYVVAADFEVPRSQQQKDYAEAIANSLELEADKKILVAYDATINSKVKTEELQDCTC